MTEPIYVGFGPKNVINGTFGSDAPVCRGRHVAVVYEMPDRKKDMKSGIKKLGRSLNIDGSQESYVLLPSAAERVEKVEFRDGSASYVVKSLSTSELLRIALKN
ncbi:MAG: hypothetical protein NT120_01190 [Candidatus Aenigmarchaeota archaeon]|nr:hypothetical protein [Candidatus Aenigmarchaeota archaeon]